MHGPGDLHDLKDLCDLKDIKIFIIMRIFMISKSLHDLKDRSCGVLSSINYSIFRDVSVAQFTAWGYYYQRSFKT